MKMNDPSKFASHDDVKEIANSMHLLTNQISNLVVELKSDRKSADERETRHNKDVDELKVALEKERDIASIDRKEFRQDVQKIKERLIPVENISKAIKNISMKIIGSLALMFVVGGMSVFAMVKYTGL